MDALALLCTLHADGPATLKRLRRAGCTSLERLDAFEPEELAGLLEVEPSVARRLRREARALIARSGGELLDREEAPAHHAPNVEAFQPAPPISVPQAAAPRAAASQAETEQPSEPVRSLGNTDRALLGRVLEEWRERDTLAPGDHRSEADADADGPTWPADPSQPDKTPSVAELTGKRLGIEWKAPSLHQPASVPSPAPAAPPNLAPEPSGPTAIPVNAIDGLDAGMAGRLAVLGVHTLAALAEADGLALSRDMGVPFGEIRRLQFLASRQAPAAPEVRAETLTPPAPLPSAAPQTQPERSTVLDWSFELPKSPPPAPSAPPEGDSAGGPFA
jgi:hypothetical protein